MRNLSYWAKYHPVHARVIIVIARCALAVIAYFLGTQLLQFGTELSPLWIYLLIITFFAAGATYPSARNRKNYSTRKMYDLVIASCGFFIVLCLANQLNRPFVLLQNSQAAVRVDPSPYKYAEAKKLLEQFQKGEKTKFTAKEKRIIKKEFKYQLGQYAKAKALGRKANAEQVLLIIVACIVAVGLLYLLSGLACTIACNGADALAVVVFVVGAAAIIWGLIRVIRSIKRKRSAQKTQSS